MSRGSMSMMSRKESDDLVIEHRLTVDDDLYFERRAFRVNQTRGEDVYSLRIVRRINEFEFYFEVSNEHVTSGRGAICRAITLLDDKGRSTFYSRWNANWTPLLPMSPVIPQGVDHVVNVDPFALCPLRSLSERSHDYIAHQWPGNTKSSLGMGTWQHVWEFETRRRMPAGLDESAREELREEGSFSNTNTMGNTHHTTGYYSGTSSAQLRRVICEEIIPPMTKGLGALERILCEGHTSSHQNRTLSMDNATFNELTKQADETYKSGGQWLEAAEAEAAATGEAMENQSWLQGRTQSMAEKTFNEMDGGYANAYKEGGQAGGMGATGGGAGGPCQLMAKIRIYGTCDVAPEDPTQM